MTAPTPPDEQDRETRLVDVHGRMIVIRQLTDAQGPLLARELGIARKPNAPTERKVVAVGRCFDLLESMVVQEEDREYLLDLNLKGTLTLGDLMGFVSAFGEPAADAPRAVRRGRTPRS